MDIGFLYVMGMLALIGVAGLLGYRNSRWDIIARSAIGVLFFSVGVVAALKGGTSNSVIGFALAAFMAAGLAYSPLKRLLKTHSRE